MSKKPKRSNRANRKVTKSRSKWAWTLLRRRYVLTISTVLVATIVFVLNRHRIASLLSSADWVLIRDYLALILSWPLVILVLGLVFMSRFRESIRIFMEKMDRIKAAGVELSQQQAQSSGARNHDSDSGVSDEVEKLEDASGKIVLTKEQAQGLADMFELQEFKYLGLHLVPNTKEALRLMYKTEVQKQAFLQIYQVPANVINQESERWAILDALTSNNLAYEENGIMRVSERGEKFLRYAGLIDSRL